MEWGKDDETLIKKTLILFSVNYFLINPRAIVSAVRVDFEDYFVQVVETSVTVDDLSSSWDTLI